MINELLKNLTEDEQRELFTQSYKPATTKEDA
jgi:hypothetical protein